MLLLFLTAETCPSFRADLAVLFGKYLPRMGVYSDIVAGCTPGHEAQVGWGGGEAFLCDVGGGQAKKYNGAGSVIVALLHEKQTPDVTKFDAEREKIVRQLAGRKQQELFQGWVTELRKKAKVEMNPAVVGGGADSEG